MSSFGQLMDTRLGALATELDGLATFSQGYPALARVRADLAAARFHLNRPAGLAPLVAILGGTGTGKSTLLNRMIRTDLSAASVRRTYTAGPIAITGSSANIPDHWLGVDHRAIDPSQLPARGEPNLLSIVATDSELTRPLTLIDTPDLDGDQPVHHAQADRVFRWADAILFVVTPEKYQMTELLPYYRMARRYGLPSLHAMNKAEEQAVVDDYMSQVEADRVFAIARDDCAYSPSPQTGLDALRMSIQGLKIAPDQRGLSNRLADLTSRLSDQVIEPMKSDRREVDRAIASLRALHATGPGVDVNPLTQQLQRRLQKRSVLYLMGPNRVLDRVRQVPGMLARLPRTTWDLLSAGKTSRNGQDEPPPNTARQAPDFRMELLDQFRIVQSRIDDLIRANPVSRKLVESSEADYVSTRIDPNLAGKIADEELGELQKWLEQKWNATPRDTAMIEKLLKYLPGGQKLTKWTEAAPYLLTIVVAVNNTFFGPVDLIIMGTWSLATWLSERLSNEVSARASQANQAIGRRFTELARRQGEQTCAWLNSRVPAAQKLRDLAGVTDRITKVLEPEHEPDAQTTGR